MKDAKANFSARFYLLEGGGLQELKVWCHELDPMDLDKRATSGIVARSSEDWVTEHIESISEMDLRSHCKLGLTGDYQCLVKGILSGEMSGYFEPEWDESIEFTEVATARIPQDFLAAMFPDEREADND